MFTKQHIFDLDFLAAENFKNVIDDILNRPAQTDELPVIITPNVDLTVHLHQNKTLLDKFQKARFILPDGFPIILFSKLLGRPLKSRLAGSDLFPLLWEASIKHHKKVIIIAPSEAVQSVLQKENNAALFYIPPIFEATEEDLNRETDNIYALIQQHQPDFVLLGLRYPKQELLVIHLHEKLSQTSVKMPLFFNLGASFEFYAGIKKRAPQWMQRCGLEWLYRFLSEPRRTFTRYFVDDLYVFVLFFKELFK